MKTLKNHTIYYDAVCPMCNMYTKAFVRSGMLDQQGRATYQCMTPEVAAKVDQVKAVNEIALINKETGEVHYGIRSMFLIFGHSFPVLQPLLRFAPFIAVSDKVYKFISYNRRVIMPSSELSEPGFQPGFHAGYRSAWLLFCWLFTVVILNRYSHHMGTVLPVGSFYREWLICGGQIVWQAILVTLSFKNKTWDYLGNMMTISLAGSLALLPGLLLGNLLQLSGYLFPIYFGLVVSLMFLEHVRRMKILHMGWLPSISWVVYRIVVLVLLFL